MKSGRNTGEIPDSDSQGWPWLLASYLGLVTLAMGAGPMAVHTADSRLADKPVIAVDEVHRFVLPTSPGVATEGDSHTALAKAAVPADAVEPIVVEGVALSSPGQPSQVAQRTLTADIPPKPRAASLQARYDAQQTPTGLDRQGVIPINFSLASIAPDKAAESGAAPADGSITVSKPLYAGGGAIGGLDITIDRASRLLISPRDVRRVLGDRVAASTLARLPDGGLVSFTRLRELGIDLRYSPSEDIIRLNS